MASEYHTICTFAEGFLVAAGAPVIGKKAAGQVSGYSPGKCMRQIWALGNLSQITKSLKLTVIILKLLSLGKLAAADWLL